MNDQPTSTTAAPAPAAPLTAGGMLRQARQAQGLHIAALAASIKVLPRKLELLESDQLDQLPDPTFTRALAQTVCRTLKIDAAPVLALLPPPRSHRLEQVAEGLNTPFNERPGRLVPNEWANLANPVLWICGVIVAMTLAVYAMPASWLPFANSAVTRPRADEATTGAASTAIAPVAVLVPDTAAPSATAGSSAFNGEATPAAEAASQPSAVASPEAQAVGAAPGPLQFRVTAPSWIEVIDARGRSLIGRVVQPGEDVDLDGVMPMKLKIGNAVATRVVFKGQPLVLAAHTRDNVARLELK